jgi:hypothetical protein
MVPEMMGVSSPASADSLQNISVPQSHRWCLMCGDQNPWSLKLRFRPTAEGTVQAAFQSHAGLQGYEGILHGGVISALLDSAMTHCLFHHGIRALTGDLHVRFLCPVPCPSSLELRAWIQSTTPPLFCLCAELLEGRQVLACADAKFMQQGGNVL